MASSANRSRLGSLSGVCPHCGLQSTFIESDLHEKIVNGSPAATTYSRLEQRLVGEPIVHFSMQRCQNCDGVILLANDVMCYPRHDLSDRYFQSLPGTMPFELRTSALRAFEQFPAEPAIASALMRLVLARMCQHVGMPQDPNTTYVSFLQSKFTNSVMRAQLDQFCMAADECVMPGFLYMDDDDVCACVLMQLVIHAAEVLFPPVGDAARS